MHPRRTGGGLPFVVIARNEMTKQSSFLSSGLTRRPRQNPSFSWRWESISKLSCWTRFSIFSKRHITLHRCHLFLCPTLRRPYASAQGATLKKVGKDTLTAKYASQKIKQWLSLSRQHSNLQVSSFALILDEPVLSLADTICSKGNE